MSSALSGPCWNPIYNCKNGIQCIWLILISFQIQHGTQPMKYYFHADFHADNSNISGNEDTNDNQPLVQDHTHLFYMV